MNYKKILFVLVIFIFLFSVSGAYAGDVADAAVASEDIGIELTTTQNDVKTIENEQMINVTDNNEVLSASDDGETVVAENDLDVLGYSQGTYSDLAGEIASGGDYIELNHDRYTYRGSVTTIAVNHTCVIDGKGAVIDMTGSEIQTFRIKADGVIFKNLNIINARNDAYSAQMYFEKSGALINCNFTNNAASKSYGGVVYFNGKGELTNCNFVSSLGLYGGAVYFNAKGELTNCNFVSNRGLYGGAVYFKGNGELTNCNFDDNFADMMGGAFLLFDGKSEVTNCNFTDNSASLMAGAAQMSSGRVENCNFINNKLRTEVDTYAGAIYFVNGGTVINSNFTNNIASLRGGAIQFNGKGNVTNCSFIGNKVTASESFGGAVYFNSNGELSNCNFANNVASSQGGAAYFENVGDVANCNFADNKVNASGSFGGAVYFSKDSTVADCNFTSNIASSHGGAVHFNGAGDVTNCSLVGNRVTSSGSFGGAVYFSEDGTVADCNFTNNIASSHGGAVYFENVGDVAGCNFAGNIVTSSGSSGGAAYFSEDGTVADCNFTNNVASSHGGAVYFEYDGELSNCNFADNKATASGSSGGAVHINNYGIVTNCAFNNNVANDGNASAIWIYFGFTENCNFTNNVASNGAVYFSWKGYVINCSFIKNTASVEGGAIWLPTGNVENCNFVSNKATAGGAILCDGDSNVTNCSFVDNKVTESSSSGIIGSYGGAIYWEGSKGVVSGCSFVRNSATYGGAIWWQGSKGAVSGCSFEDNTAVEGGAIWWRGSYGAVSDCSFEDNSALRGGAIWWRGSYGAVSDCSFEDNSAEGGAIWWQGSYGAVSGCSFVRNSATNYGGAIYWQSSNGTVSGCVFVNNRANNGIIHFRNSQEPSADSGRNLTINDNIFLNNNGVLIYFSRDDSISNANYNWFGNNATNYNVKPAFSHVTINNWLFLNGTANPDNITFSGTSDVIFKLYAYNSTVVSDYDNDLLSKVNLTMTATNGEVNVTEAELGESVLFSADDEGMGKVTARIENVACTVPLTIVKGTSFRDLNKTINGNNDDVVILDRDYTYDPTIDYNFKDGIVINRPVTIIGNNYTLNALNQARIFNIRADNVVIENITFENAKSTGEGGAVYWNGAYGNLSDCDFVNNSAEGTFGDGGAVYWNGAYGNLHDCDFVNNSAASAGAVYWNGAYGNLYDCNFVNSFADFTGGAIYWDGNNGNLSDCEFVNNSAGDKGGAVFWDGDNGNLYDCEFVNNSAYEPGGAVYWKSSDNGTVSGCIFANNSAEVGGAILWFESENCVVSDCIFENNRAVSEAGAVFWDDADRCLLFDSIFVNNSAQTAGAVLWDGKKGNLYDCVFEDNSAQRGGAVYWDRPEGSISGCIFVNNTADQGIVHSRNGVYDDLAINHNIFLNNNGVAIYFYKITSNSSTDYNWFGNNATNYDEEPIIVNGTIGNWLFLNATADPASIAINESSDVIFKLYSYGSTGVSDYDNSQLYPINLTVTATNAEVGSIAALGESILYNQIVFEPGSVTAKFANVGYTILIGIRIDPNLSFGPREVIYSNSTLIAVSYNSTATGKLNITLIGKKSNYLFVDLDLNETIQLGDIGADEYEVTAKYSGDYNFASSTVTGTLTVNKADSSVILNNVEFDEGEHIIIIAITEGAEGVTAKIDGNNVDVINNVILVPEGLDNGNHTLEVTTIPDKNHNSVNTTVTISVGGRESADVNVTIPSDIPVGDDVTIKIDIPDATGNVTVYVDGGEYVAELVNGSVNVTISGLSGGNHTVVVEYSGDDKYAPFTKVVTLNVPKVDIPVDELKVNVTLPIGGKSPTVTIKLPEDTTGYVLVSVNGYEYHIDVNNATANITLPALSYGKHDAKVTYPGDGKYNPVIKNITINVPEPNVTAKDVAIRYSDNGPYRIHIAVDGKAVDGQYVTINFNGKTYKYLTNSNGDVLFKIPSIKPNTYTIIAKYNDVSISKKIKISNIIVVKTKKIKKSSKKVKIKVKLKTVKNKYIKSKKLTLKINGKNIKAKTNKKGIAIFKLKKSIVKKLKVGKKYKVKVSYGKDILTKKIKILR